MEIRKARAVSRATGDRVQTLGEEIANSVSHGLALFAAVASLVWLLGVGRPPGASGVVGAAVFGGTMVFLYLASTLYHALPAGRAKRVLLRIDHSAIYLFIAGSYTPFCLGVLGGPWGWTLFGLVWAIAVTGVTMKAVDRLSQPWFSTGLYLAMGWLAVIAADQLVERVPPIGLALLVAGGVAYTLGVIFFVLDSRLRYAHAVWHGFVVAGSGLHFFAVLGYASAPA